MKILVGYRTGRENRRPRKDVVEAVVEQDFGTHKGSPP